MENLFKKAISKKEIILIALGKKEYFIHDNKTDWFAKRNLETCLENSRSFV